MTRLLKIGRATKLTSWGTFDAVRPPGGVYPYRPRQICVFAQLVGAVRETPVHVEIANARTRSLVYAFPPQQVRFPGRRTIMNACFRIHHCVFPKAGVYIVELYANGIFLEDRVLHLLAPAELKS